MKRQEYRFSSAITVFYKLILRDSAPLREVFAIRIGNPQGAGKPFLKWVGGKTQLSDEIFRTFPQDFFARESATYIEPFVGGGAILFRLLRDGAKISRAVVNDLNPALIAAYRCVRDNAETLIREL